MSSWSVSALSGCFRVPDVSVTALGVGATGTAAAPQSLSGPLAQLGGLRLAATPAGLSDLQPANHIDITSSQLKSQAAPVQMHHMTGQFDDPGVLCENIHLGRESNMPWNGSSCHGSVQYAARSNEVPFWLTGMAGTAGMMPAAPLSNTSPSPGSATGRKTKQHELAW